MKIITVEYRRLRSYGEFQNETVGAMAEVRFGEEPDQALASLRAWVDRQLGDNEEQRRLSERVTELRWKADSYERKIALSEQRWAAIMAFLDKLGIARPEEIPDDLKDLPF